MFMCKQHRFIILLTLSCLFSLAQNNTSKIEYTVSMKNPENQRFQMQMDLIGFKEDTLNLKLPNWSPGYYQLMHYYENIENLNATDTNGQVIPITRLDNNTWQLIPEPLKTIHITYDVHSTKRFVANSLLDSTHAYIIPANNFLYPKGYLDYPSIIKINLDSCPWGTIATGLKSVE